MIRHLDGREEEKALTLPPIRNSHAYGSQIAELLAVSHALQAVPDKNNAVTVHMDCLPALQALQNRKAPDSKQRNLPSLRAAFKIALAAVKRFENIDLVLASDKTDRRMSRAHGLSRIASMAPPEIQAL